MNVIARIFLALYSLLLIAACGGLIALSYADEEKLDLQLGDYNVQALVITSDGARIAVTVILAAIALIAAMTVLVAFLPWGRRSPDESIRIQRTGGGTVEMTASSIERLLADELRPLPGVQDVSAQVRSRGGTIESEIELAIDPGTNIAEVTSTVSEATGAILRQQIGATQVRRPTIRITYDELDVQHPARRSGPPEGPLPPPPPPPSRGPAEAAGSGTQTSWEPPRPSIPPPPGAELSMDDEASPEEDRAGTPSDERPDGDVERRDG